MKSVAARTRPTLISKVARDSNALVGLGRPVKSVRHILGDLSSNTSVSSTSASSSMCVGLSEFRRLWEWAAVEATVGGWSSTSTSVTVTSISSAMTSYFAWVKKLLMKDGI